MSTTSVTRGKGFVMKVGELTPGQLIYRDVDYTIIWCLITGILKKGRSTTVFGITTESNGTQKYYEEYGELFTTISRDELIWGVVQ